MMVKNSANFVSLMATTLFFLGGCNQPTTPPQATNAPAQNSTTQATNTSSGTAIPVDNNLGTVKFKDSDRGTVAGSFDAVNNSPDVKHTAPKNVPLQLVGWAILPNTGKPADKVIVTSEKPDVILAIVSVDVARPDVAKALKNQALEKAGWKASIDPSRLQPGETTLKAWAYNAETKEATSLAKIHKIDIQ